MREPRGLVLIVAALVTSVGFLVPGVGCAEIRYEALSPEITRIWLKVDGSFVRPLSRAMVDRAVSSLTATPPPNVAALLPDWGFEWLPQGGWRLQFGLRPEEHLYGLGQDNQNHGRLDRRGTVRDLWAGQQIQSGNVTAQYPVPFLLSSGLGGRAYGLFFDSVQRLRFDLAASQSDRVRVEAGGGEFDFYLIAGPRLADVIGRYTQLTGRPSLPPLWALGYWQSKCTFWDWDDLDRAYEHLHADGFPVDVMVIDADWPEVVTDYRWARRWRTSGHGLTPEQKIAGYARKGVKIVMSQSGPMVRSDSPTYVPGWLAGVFATDGRGHPVQCGYYDGKLLDFTHPRMNEWLWPQTRPLVEAGIAGWWLDLDEPENEPVETHYWAGRPAEIHNQYALLCALSFEGVQLAAHPQRRPFLLSRSASAGYQRHHGAVWSGDVASDYPTFRAHPPEMLNTGLSGLPYWTCDTGGFLSGYYHNDRYGAHARLYERWMQFSAFSPIARAHKAGGEPEPYAFGAETEASARHYLQLRYRLLPYLYSYAWEATQDGLPLVRALPLEFDDPGSLAAPGDEYLFGRDLLVAPVLEEGATQRSVYFPPGQWSDWDTGAVIRGGRSVVVAAPFGHLPLAVRAGAIIPLAPPMSTTGERAWDPLTVEIFPSGRSTFTLYADDGQSFGYERGAFTLTRFACDTSDHSIRFQFTVSNAAFAATHYELHFHLTHAPRSVAVDGARLMTKAWDPARGVLTVPVAREAQLEHVLSIDEGL